MPIFTYLGRDSKGKQVKGKRLAQSAETLSVLLSKESITPIRITLEKEYLQYWDKIKSLMGDKSISIEELALFARQMHVLTKAGVPVTNALKQLAQNLKNITIVNALYGMAENLESGQDLALTMQNYPKIFSPLMISMVKVGESSGFLDQAFLRLNEYLELESSAIKRFKTIFRYPIIVFSTILIAIILMNIFVIPTFANMFSKAGIELPLATRFLIGMSYFFTHYWPYLIMIVGGFCGAIYFYLKSPKGKLFWDQYQFKLPIIGQVIRRVALLRFTQAFTMSINAGIPILESLLLVSDIVNNEYIRFQLLDLREAIQRGKTLAQAARESPLFSGLELQMLTISEETGELGNMLEQISFFYRQEVDYDLKKLSDLLEPLLIIILASLILILALAIYMPIWKMIKLVK